MFFTKGDSNMDTIALAQSYVDQSQDIDDLEERFALIKKALALDPHNIEAKFNMAVLVCESDELLEDSVREILEEATEEFQQKGYFTTKYLGNFYDVEELQPYVRLQYWYMTFLMDHHKYKKAVDVGKRLIRFCKQDDMGARYALMFLYAMLEDVDAAEKLFVRFASKETLMGLPFAIVLYATGDMERTRQALQFLLDTNVDTEIFLDYITGHDMPDDVDFDDTLVLDDDYEPNTIDEYFVALNQYHFCLFKAGAFFAWAEAELEAYGEAEDFDDEDE